MPPPPASGPPAAGGVRGQQPRLSAVSLFLWDLPSAEENHSTSIRSPAQDGSQAAHGQLNRGLEAGSLAQYGTTLWEHPSSRDPWDGSSPCGHRVIIPVVHPSSLSWNLTLHPPQADLPLRHLRHSPNMSQASQSRGSPPSPRGCPPSGAQVAMSADVWVVTAQGSLVGAARGRRFTLYLVQDAWPRPEDQAAPMSPAQRLRNAVLEHKPSVLFCPRLTLLPAPERVPGADQLLS